MSIREKEEGDYCGYRGGTTRLHEHFFFLKITHPCFYFYDRGIFFVARRLNTQENNIRLTPSGGPTYSTTGVADSTRTKVEHCGGSGQSRKTGIETIFEYQV